MQALLAVGGQDPTGGAGVTQDALQAHDCGIWCCSVVSALTIQTPHRFDRALPTADTDFVAMLEAAAQSVDVAGVKTGYLATPAQVEYLAAFLRSLRAERPGLPIIVDPVGVPTAGQEAPERRAVLRAVTDKLIPLATVVTPNRAELAVLADHPVDDALGLELAAKRLVILGAQAVLVTSAEGDDTTSIDRFITRYDNEALAVPRTAPAQIHGSGCALAARLAAHAALGMEARDAARAAAHEIAAMRPAARHPRDAPQALLSPLPLGGDPEAPPAVLRLEAIVPTVLRLLPADWVAECGNNLAFADRDAEAPDEVATLRQRIRLRDGRPHTAAAAWRAPNSHVARVALAARRVTGAPACALNLRHTPAVLAAAADAGFRVGTFDRADEPASAVSSVEWGTVHVLGAGTVDLVADRGGAGKEPMLRLIAEDPDDLVQKLARLVSPAATATH